MISGSRLLMQDFEVEAMKVIQIIASDMIFMDIQLPDKNGLELTRMIIKARHPNAIIVILTNYDLEEYWEAV